VSTGSRRARSPTFLAVPAAGLGAALHEVLRLPGVPPARQVPVVDYHVTLHYLGPQPAERLAALAAALEAVGGARFPMLLAGAGTFRGEAGTEVLWVGVEPTADLLALHARVGLAIRAVGLPLESRPYRPHLTVARVNDAVPELADHFVRANRDLRLAIEVGSFDLYVTGAGTGGARYATIASWPLAAERPHR
jgi:RNA 2',3'-cyclic 3'-phosphodiesterase